MIRYFCDKCGKALYENTNFNTTQIFTVKIEPPEIRSWRDDAEIGTYILCYDCIREFNKWVGDWKKNSLKVTAMSYPQEVDIPDACKTCKTHPSNGGNGICHCTLGIPEVR